MAVTTRLGWGVDREMVGIELGALPAALSGLGVLGVVRVAQLQVRAALLHPRDADLEALASHLLR